MLRNILCCLLATYYIFATESEKDVIVYDGKIRISLSSIDPRADMCLSSCPMHQRPPIFLITLPHGQRIILIGTTHVFPLWCMLPYGLARELIEQSSFTFNEVHGELLYGACKKIGDSGDKPIPDFAVVKKEDITKIAAGGRAFLQPFYSDNELDRKVDEAMSTIFDSDGSWYAKAGLLDRNDILGQIVRELPKDRELHPAALSYAYEVLTDTQFYHPPSCGYMDHHLNQMVQINYGRILHALEDDEERFSDGFFEKNNAEMQATIVSDCQNIIWYKSAITNLLKYANGDKQNTTIESYNPGQFYSYKVKLKVDDTEEVDSINLAPTKLDQESYNFLVLERNVKWCTEIMSLDSKSFSLASGWGGILHLLDLFEKLRKKGCQVSTRLSLADLEEILLDEATVLRNHARLKAVYKRLFF